MPCSILFQEEEPPQFPGRIIIASATELQERSLIKLSTLSAVLQDGLRHRGVDGHTAAFVSDAAVTIFNLAYNSWGEHPTTEFGTLMHQYLAEFRQAILAPAVQRPD